MWLIPQIEKNIENGHLQEQNKIDEFKQYMEFSFVGEVDKYSNNN
jgi:hypothetical protein